MNTTAYCSRSAFGAQIVNFMFDELLPFLPGSAFHACAQTARTDKTHRSSCLPEFPWVDDAASDIAASSAHTCDRASFDRKTLGSGGKIEDPAVQLVSAQPSFFRWLIAIALVHAKPQGAKLIERFLHRWQEISRLLDGAKRNALRHAHGKHQIFCAHQDRR